MGAVLALHLYYVFIPAPRNSPLQKSLVMLLNYALDQGRKGTMVRQEEEVSKG